MPLYLSPSPVGEGGPLAVDEVSNRKAKRVVEGADPYRDGARFAHGAYMDPDTGHKKAHCRSDAPFVFKFSVYTSFSAYTSLRRVAMSSAALAMKSETVISTVLSSLPRTETWPEATSLSPTMSM